MVTVHTFAPAENWLPFVRTVSIPQREMRTASVSSHDGVPLRCRCVDAESNTSSISSTNETLKEGTIASLVSPILSSFNVQPKTANMSAIGLQMCDSSLDLSFRISTMRAREAGSSSSMIAQRERSTRKGVNEWVR